MEKHRRLYLSILSKIWLKSLLRVFLNFKYELFSRPKPQVAPSAPSVPSNPRTRVSKFKSLTESQLRHLVEPRDLFEELKSSLNSKILQGEFTPVSASEKMTSPKGLHTKNNLSFTPYLNKGTRKTIIKSSAEPPKEVAVVSSSSLVNLKTSNKMSIFSMKP